MARFAAVIASNVCQRFPCRAATVMAAKAVCADITVIDIGWAPALRGMALLTIVATRHMGIVFASGDGCVMAAKAGTQYGKMIDLGGRHPAAIAMALAALLIGTDVSVVFSSGIDTVVTTLTTA